ncbi:protein TIC 100-like [Aristolochia californica]|uniref:protein TIC 100-like n=1 Tax=Aristolochia californica TaxID=171875 RepID=UPI0035DECD5C
MPDKNSAHPLEDKQEPVVESEEEKEEEDDDSSESSTKEEEEAQYEEDDYDYYSDSDDSEDDNNEPYIEETYEEVEDDKSPEAVLRKFNEVLDSREYKKRLEKEDRGYVFYEDLFDFPEDPEKWREEDLEEYWEDAPLGMTEPGWDPVWADEEDWEVVREELQAGRDPKIAPFYVPYRRYFPAIPDNHFDISNPKSVIEELDRIEEFLKWVSYIFPDGSSYEGTVWDDLAHGKGVYIAESGLVRYEGEWLQNNMEGHGVVEVDIPGREPIPGSKLEAKMRAEGQIIARDYMSPEDREWLEMDIEDSVMLSNGRYEIPWDDNNEWVRQFGKKPEKGRYRYAGQWKHGRMHGCGVYEVNNRVIFGRFYFGELMQDSTGCEADIATLHSGIAEVAAAKARMFVNKPDGMVREERGPYSDPQHPYFYDEDDVWMAPGFINQFFEVPDYWKRYVKDVDQEREMWLNSFYKSPLRIPMPAELSYWWEKDEYPEFVLINQEPEPDPDDPSKLIYTEDPLIVHTPTGKVINYVDDEKYGIRLFWQPPLEEGEDVDPSKTQFLPLGYDEFFGQAVPGTKKESKLMGLVVAVENFLRPIFEKLDKWSEEKKKGSDLKLKLIDQELEFVEAQVCLEEAIEDFENELKKQQKEEEKRAEMTQVQSEDISSIKADSESDEEEEEEQDEETPVSFGTAFEGEATKGPAKDDRKEKGTKPGESPFSASSLSFASASLASAINFNLKESLVEWKKGKTQSDSTVLFQGPWEVSNSNSLMNASLVNFPQSYGPYISLKSEQDHRKILKKTNKNSQLQMLARVLSGPRVSFSPKNLPKGHANLNPKLTSEPEEDLHRILSLHIPLHNSIPCPDLPF